MEKTVVAIHQHSDEWALLVSAARQPDGKRYLTSAIFVAAHSPLLAANPWLVARGAIVLHTQHVRENQRGAILEGAVASFIGDLKQATDLLEMARTAFLPKMAARLAFSPEQALAAFDINNQAALLALLDSSFGDTARSAMDTLRLCCYLAQVRGIDKLTQDERQALGTEKVMGGYRGLQMQSDGQSQHDDVVYDGTAPAHRRW